MIKICAWCEQEDQRDIQAQRLESSSEQISHGICHNHARRLRHSYRSSLHRQSAALSPHRSLALSSQF